MFFILEKLAHPVTKIFAFGYFWVKDFILFIDSFSPFLVIAQVLTIIIDGWFLTVAGEYPWSTKVCDHRFVSALLTRQPKLMAKKDFGIDLDLGFKIFNGFDYTIFKGYFWFPA